MATQCIRLLTAICTLTIAAATSAQDHPYPLIYDAADGTLTIDTGSDVISTYIISGGPFREENHLNLFNVRHVDIVSTDDSIEVGLLILDAFPQGVFQIGEVLPAGLTEQELNAAITFATYTEDFGQPIRDFQIVHTPEPGSLALLGLGGSALFRRRRALA